MTLGTPDAFLSNMSSQMTPKSEKALSASTPLTRGPGPSDASASAA